MASTQSSLIYIGCAGWTLPVEDQERFPAGNSHLARYAAYFPAAEINSSFHKSHRPATYERWAASVPASFRFSAKLPKTITHEKRLVGCGKLLDQFLGEVGALGPKLGCLLVQMPPSLAYGPQAKRFFTALKNRYTGAVAAEPRHASWFTPEADSTLSSLGIARVAADPAVVPRAAQPGGWPGIAYFRLHGSPRMYYSTYARETLREYATQVRSAAATSKSVWCMFDNTTLGAAVPKAIELLSLTNRT